jgi:hypothetical protein
MHAQVFEGQPEVPAVIELDLEHAGLLVHDDAGGCRGLLV